VPFYRPCTAFFDEESRLSSLLLLEARLSCVPFAVVSIEIYEMVSTGKSPVYSFLKLSDLLFTVQLFIVKSVIILIFFKIMSLVCT